MGVCVCIDRRLISWGQLLANERLCWGAASSKKTAFSHGYFVGSVPLFMDLGFELLRLQTHGLDLGT